MLNKNLVRFLFLISIPLITIVIANIDLNTKPTICLFNNILGKECLGCGITKAILSLIKGQLNQAAHYNFNVIFVFPILLTVWIKKIFQSYKLLSN